MKKLSLLPATMIVAMLVALTYHIFEQSVHHATSYLWTTLLPSDTVRRLVIPLCLVGGVIFFGLQHYLDPNSESHESKGLGSMPTPTLANFASIIVIGFFSLIAGASLGPEAILVPACLVVGGFVGSKLYKNDHTIVGLLSAMGLVALFAAFFNSFLTGLLGLLLISKQAKTKLNTGLVVLGSIASAVTVLTLRLIDGQSFISLPPHSWKISLLSILIFALLFVAGWGYTHVLGWAHNSFEKIRQLIKKQPWLWRAVLAGAGLALLYLLGGPLVQFTGNESIEPMFAQASALGSAGLVWLFIVKTLAISWSKALGYRGGLIFPSVFAASVLIAIGRLFDQNISLVLALIVIMTGMLVADRKIKILV